MGEAQEIEEDVEKAGKGATKYAKEQVSIIEPMFAWIVLLVVALILRILLTYTTFLSSANPYYGVFSSISTFILFMPGAIILPLIVGAIIGTNVGLKSANMKSARKAGLLNGVYVAVVYVVAIVIIYEVMAYVLPSIAPNLFYLLTTWLALPIVILILLSFFFAILSNSRKVS